MDKENTIEFEEWLDVEDFIGSTNMGEPDFVLIRKRTDNKKWIIVWGND